MPKPALQPLPDDAPVTLAPSVPKEIIVAAFRSLQAPTREVALRLKVIMFFNGLIVKEMTEHFRHEHGETRGRPENNGNVSVISTPSLEAYLEEHLEVTARTCRNHRNFWEAVTTSNKHAKAVKALNGVWVKHVEALQLEAPKKGKAAKPHAPGPAPHALTLQDRCTELAAAVEGLLEEADALELHTLFEKPASGPVIDAETGEEEEDSRKTKALEAVDQLCRKLGGARPLYLYAPKPARERLQTELEEALAKLKALIKPAATKGGKKG